MVESTNNTLSLHCITDQNNLDWILLDSSTLISEDSLYDQDAFMTGSSKNNDAIENKDIQCSELFQNTLNESSKSSFDHISLANCMDLENDCNLYEGACQYPFQVEMKDLVQGPTLAALNFMGESVIDTCDSFLNHSSIYKELNPVVKSPINSSHYNTSSAEFTSYFKRSETVIVEPKSENNLKYQLDCSNANFSKQQLRLLKSSNAMKKSTIKSKIVENSVKYRKNTHVQQQTEDNHYNTCVKNFAKVKKFGKKRKSEINFSKNQPCHLNEVSSAEKNLDSKECILTKKFKFQSNCVKEKINSKFINAIKIPKTSTKSFDSLNKCPRNKMLENDNGSSEISDFESPHGAESSCEQDKVLQKRIHTAHKRRIKHFSPKSNKIPKEESIKNTNDHQDKTLKFIRNRKVSGFESKMDEEILLPAKKSASSKNFGKKKKRYFWQYNMQPNRYKTLQLPKSITSFAKKVKDATRKEYKNDFDPNPKRLYSIGLELAGLNDTINKLTPACELPISVRPKSRREKNKLASRVCRLKKKANHEANKIKLFGLKREEKHLKECLDNIKKSWNANIEKAKNCSLLTIALSKSMHKEKTISKVAGCTTEFVNRVLEIVASGDDIGNLNNL